MGGGLSQSAQPPAVCARSEEEYGGWGEEGGILTPDFCKHMLALLSQQLAAHPLTPLEPSPPPVLLPSEKKKPNHF